jgi:hypothetical protein
LSDLVNLIDNPLYDPRYEDPWMTLASAICHQYNDAFCYQCPFNRDQLSPANTKLGIECLVGRWGSKSSAHMRLVAVA